jgi:hypothetical protein
VNSLLSSKNRLTANNFFSKFFGKKPPNRKLDNGGNPGYEKSQEFSKKNQRKENQGSTQFSIEKAQKNIGTMMKGRRKEGGE